MTATDIAARRLVHAHGRAWMVCQVLPQAEDERQTVLAVAVPCSEDGVVDVPSPPAQVIQINVGDLGKGAHPAVRLPTYEHWLVPFNEVFTSTEMPGRMFRALARAPNELLGWERRFIRRADDGRVIGATYVRYDGCQGPEPEPEPGRSIL